MINLSEYLSKAGYSHVNDALNQDFVLSGENESLYAATLADGVTSCSKSRTGAEIACKMLLKLFLRKGNFFLNTESQGDMKKITELIISYVLYELEKKATNDGRNIEEYSCTLAGILVDTECERMLYFSTGDSIVMAIPQNGDKCKILTHPDSNLEGICVTTTKNATSMSKIGIISTKEFSSAVIFSDGAWHKIFNRNTLKNEVRDILISHDYNKLKEFLNNQAIFDDYSFVALNFDEIIGGEKSA